MTNKEAYHLPQHNWKILSKERKNEIKKEKREKGWPRKNFDFPNYLNNLASKLLVRVKM